MNVVVIGARGFVGNAVRVALDDAEAGYTSFMVARERPDLAVPDCWAALDLVRAFPAEIRAVLADFGADVVVNCAGAVAGDRRTLLGANVRILLNLLDAIGGMGYPPRLVQIGSGAEYGPGRSKRPAGERRPARPLSAYGRTKLLATDLVQTAVATRGLDGVVLRVFNPVGPGAPEHTLVGTAARKIRAAIWADADVELGSLDAVRDFVDIRDVAQAVIAACSARDVAGRIINIGSGVGTTARALVAELATAAGFVGAIVETAGGSPRSSGISWQQADITQAGRVLGWRPTIALERSMADLWAGMAPTGAPLLSGARS
jgi:NDP-hexose 4-ketoreductase